MLNFNNSFKSRQDCMEFKRRMKKRKIKIINKNKELIRDGCINIEKEKQFFLIKRILKIMHDFQSKLL